MRHARVRRRPVPDEIAGAILRPGEPRELPLHPGEPLDLGHCFRSGQIFRWRQVGEAWYGPFGGSALALRMDGGVIRAQLAGAPVPLREVYRFLALDAPLAAIYRGIETDRHVTGAV